MRCLSCDRRLNDRESTRKYSSSGTFIDLCNRCFAYIADEVPSVDEDGFDPLEFIEEDSDEEGGTNWQDTTHFLPINEDPNDDS